MTINQGTTGETIKDYNARKIGVSQLPKYLRETRWVVSVVPVEMTEDEVKQRIGDDKVLYAKQLISKNKGNNTINSCACCI